MHNNVKKLYLSLHVLSVELFIHIGPGYVLLNRQPSVSDLDRQT